MSYDTALRDSAESQIIFGYSLRLMARPNFFIVGAAKSGTTSMLRYLAQHPEISMPQRREPIHFGRDLTSHKKRMSAEEYSNVFASTADEKIIGEKSVWYLYSESAAEEIKAYNKDAKIMIMLRNPIYMIYSLHQQFLATGNEDEPSFDKALKLIDQRAAGRCIPSGAHFPDGLVYTKVPLYSEQVARFLRAFGKEKVKVIRFEDFSQSTAIAYADALRFLEVSEEFAPNFVVYNKKMNAKSSWIERLGDSRAIEMFPGSLRKALGWQLYKLNATEERRLPMSPEVRATLRDHFRPEVERLSALLDRDFTDWCAATG